jgi:hypothetical protein
MLASIEFRLAFSRYAEVVFEKQPERRKELSAYSALIDQLYMQYRGTYFYDYHRAFARKAEQYYINLCISVDWASRDTGLHMQIFSGLRATVCNNCQGFDHFSDFCPTVRDLTQSTARQLHSARSVDSRETPAALATPPPKKVDVRGRKRIHHNGFELCNNYNSGQCNFRHTPASRLVHWCSTCFATQHPALECPQRPAATQSTSTAVVPFSRKP